MSNKQTTITKDAPNKKLIVVREFDAPLEEIWKAWTDKDILDKWWAPKPYKSKTKTMDFREGGVWIYSMVGPDGTASYTRADFKTIVENKSYTGDDAFCDENGNITNNYPGMHWKCEFSATDTGTKVEVEITFASEADMHKIIEMGFEVGFTAAHGNLDELLERQFSNPALSS
ncbi:MAG: Ligand-binding SRPBCC domain protein family [uncultured Segetibacter sp.]|uniref:Ligand-binding SRPBCC domain protein family n=1 Tax=uncultured Segetibacter sp. TaxID=481133 RepID=A0A6J4TMD1_9BACT|nr:MAG: Ligand-binding SRPBCC domain protein family [uncultured Segetibacter sp.]